MIDYTIIQLTYLILINKLLDIKVSQKIKVLQKMPVPRDVSQKMPRDTGSRTGWREKVGRRLSLIISTSVPLVGLQPNAWTWNELDVIGYRGRRLRNNKHNNRGFCLCAKVFTNLQLHIHRPRWCLDEWHPFSAQTISYASTRIGDFFSRPNYETI